MNLTASLPIGTGLPSLNLPVMVVDRVRQVAGTPESWRPGWIGMLVCVVRCEQISEQLTARLGDCEGDGGLLDVVAALLPGKLGAVGAVVLTLDRGPGLALDAPLLLVGVLDGGGSGSGTTSNSANSAGPGSDAAHLNRDDDWNGNEGSRCVLDQADGGEGGDGGRLE